ncbi:hypothetical protein SOJ85_003025 [Cronobacter turicensis]|nr:hypothetical protein [Cronobacter turicensis]
MISIFLALLSSFGYLSFMHLSMKRRAAETLFYFISVAVLFLYIFSLPGQLKSGAIIFCAGGISLLAYQISKGINLPKTNNISWMVLYSIPFVAFIFAIKTGFVFTGWDEFSFWVSSIKLIYSENSIYTVSTPLTAFKNYPPGQQLWQFYSLFFFGWSERLLLASHSFFILSATLFATSRLSSESKPSTFIIFVLSISLIYIFGYDLKHVYVDQLLGVYFAATFALAVTARTRIDIFFLCVSLANLVIIKQIGLIFALFSAAAFVTLAIISRSEIRKKTLVISSFLSFLVIPITYKSWSWYVKSINFPSNTSLPSLNQFSQSPLKEKAQGTIHEFLHRFFDTSFLNLNGWVFKVTMFEAFIGMLAAGIVLCLLSKGTWRVKGLLIQAGMSIFGLAYLSFLIVCYISFFTPYESLKLASFERYSATFFLAWGIIILCQASYALEAKCKKSKYLASFFALAFFGAVAPSSLSKDFLGIYPNETKTPLIDKIAKATALIKTHIKDGERAYLIDQNSNGYSAVVFNYYMLPYRPFSWCWSLGNSYNKSDQWTCDKTLSDVLKGVSYLYLYRTDDQFWSRNGIFFKSKHPGNGNGVYQVSWDKDKRLSITPL